jgi:hypothetical protein
MALSSRRSHPAYSQACKQAGNARHYVPVVHVSAIYEIQRLMKGGGFLRGLLLLRLEEFWMALACKALPIADVIELVFPFLFWQLSRA